MRMTNGQFESSPTELLLGALSMVALPLVRGEDGEEMIETAQFYGFEDWGDCFKNVSPRISQLTAYRPTANEAGCIIGMTFHRFVLPGALHRAAGRWAKSVRMPRHARHEWRGAGLVLTLSVSPYRLGERHLRARLAPHPPVG